MSAKCPENVRQISTPDAELTVFGECMDIARTPRGRVHAGAPPVPSRPNPSRPDEGSGLFSSRSQNRYSPDPVTASVAREVWHHLTAGLRMLSLNDHGRDWPLPRRDRLAALLAEFDDDLCIAAAREAREIVQVQDRAPNVTALFEKKLRHLAEVRSAVRDSLGVSA